MALAEWEIDESGYGIGYVRWIWGGGFSVLRKESGQVRPKKIAWFRTYDDATTFLAVKMTRLDRFLSEKRENESGE
jgi:hypothetical protein